MKEINFKQIGMENFCCYTSPPMIVDIIDNQLVVVTGKNGVGKTTIFDAIPYTLYGTTSKGQTGDDVVNRREKKNCHTWVEFTIGEDQYRVDRYRKYKKIKDSVILTKNGTATHKGQKDVGPEIDKLIMPSKLFMNILFFGQKVSSFFTDLRDSEQKEIFRKIIQLDEYVTYYETASRLLKELSARYDEITNTISIKTALVEDADSHIQYYHQEKEQFYVNKKLELDKLHNQVKATNEELSKLKEKHQELIDLNLDVRYEELSQQLAEITTELNNIHEVLTASTNEISSQSQLKKQELVSKAETLTADLNSKHASAVSNIKQEFGSFKESIQAKATEIQLELKELDSALSLLDYKIVHIDSEIKQNNISCDAANDEICPTCGQSTTDIRDSLIEQLFIKNKKLEESKLEYSTKISELNAKKQELNEQLEDLKEKILEKKAAADKKLNDLTAEFNEQTSSIQTKLKAALSKLREYTAEKIQEANKDIADKKKNLSNRVTALTGDKVKLTHLRQMTSQIFNEINAKSFEVESTEGSIHKLEAAEYDETNLNNYQKTKQDLNSEIDELQRALVDLDKRKTILDFWKSGFSSSGIPSMLIDEAIPFMNSRIKEYLELIECGRYIVSFDTLATTKKGEFRDKISVNVLDTQSLSDTRKNFSSGQKRIVDICTILTLSDLQTVMQNVKFNIMLFDEIFDNLDDDNIQYVSTVLRKLATNRAIWMISHRHSDSIEYDNLIELTGSF